MASVLQGNYSTILMMESYGSKSIPSIYLYKGFVLMITGGFDSVHLPHNLLAICQR